MPGESNYHPESLRLLHTYISGRDSTMETSPSTEMAFDTAGAKRKRSPVDDPVGRPAPAMMGSGSASAPTSVPQIKYLVKASSEKLKLMDGDAETFSDVLETIDDYEGVLQRHESLAANLGAKLVGPLLVKSFEKLFDGPIKIIQSSFAIEQTPITWLDLVNYARTNPDNFTLGKTCLIWINGGQVEISEDDYRLIMSGAPDRMIPTQPILDDEAAELGTINIIEARLAMLIKKADAVASKARQLNYHLKGRRTNVMARRAAENPGLNPSDSMERTYSPQPFSAINATSSKAANGEGSKLQQDLLELYLANDRRQSKPKGSRAVDSDDSYNGGGVRRTSLPAIEVDIEGKYRALMAAKIEKLQRGETIDPPCDRCRRLKFDCKKHLTACSSCTKKHARCSWRDIKRGELDETPQSSSTSKRVSAAAENRHITGPTEVLFPGLVAQAAKTNTPPAVPVVEKHEVVAQMPVAYIDAPQPIAAGAPPSAEVTGTN